MVERMTRPQLREEYQRQAETAWRQACVIEELLTEVVTPPGKPA